MGYVRYKLSNESHDILRKVSRRLGMKESELSRLALMEYLKSLGMLSERVKKGRMRLKI
jgi:AraC-like DNA-binding protein